MARLSDGFPQARKPCGNHFAETTETIKKPQGNHTETERKPTTETGKPFPIHGRRGFRLTHVRANARTSAALRLSFASPGLAV